MFLSTIQSIQSMLTRCADNLSVLHVFPSHMMYGCRAPAYLGTSTVAEFPSPFFQHQINLQRLSDDDYSPFPAARSTSYSTRKFVSVHTVRESSCQSYSQSCKTEYLIIVPLMYSHTSKVLNPHGPCAKTKRPPRLTPRSVVLHDSLYKPIL
jgi:hypothetical protein